VDPLEHQVSKVVLVFPELWDPLELLVHPDLLVPLETKDQLGRQGIQAHKEAPALRVRLALLVRMVRQDHLVH